MRPRDWEIRLFNDQRRAAEGAARQCGVASEDARDIAQEALAIVARRIAEGTFVFYSAEPIEQTKIAAAFLRTTARRIALHHREHEEQRRAVERDPRPRASDLAEETEQRSLARFLLEQTDTPNRRALLGWAEGEEAWETSIAQGCGCNTVFTRRHLARRDLRAAVRREMARAESCRTLRQR